MAGKKPWTMLWLKAVRDQPDRPPPVQRHVLTCLLLRVDWESGEGFASTESLMADADCGGEHGQAGDLGGRAGTACWPSGSAVIVAGTG